MFEARVHIATPPSEQRWKELMALAELTTESNAHWYGAQLDYATQLEAQGLPGKAPPCCLACVKPPVVYRAPPPGAVQHCQHWWSAQQVLDRGRANCLDASTYDAGAARAEGKEAYVMLEPQGEPTLPGDPYSTLDFHAVAYIDGERVDSSAKLQSKGGCGCG